MIDPTQGKTPSPPGGANGSTMSSGAPPEGVESSIEAPIAPGAGTETGVEAKPGERHALVVDDEPFSIELIARHLRPRGFRVDVAFSGAEAIEKINSVEYDVVIADVRMPNGSGIDLLRELQALSRPVPVILMSADAKGAKAQAKAMSADAFLVKPIVMQELDQTLARLTGPLTH